MMPRYNRPDESMEEKVFIDFHMMRDIIRANEYNRNPGNSSDLVNNRRNWGFKITEYSNDFRNFRNHIAHFKVGINDTIITTFIGHSVLMDKTIKIACTYNTEIKPDVYRRFHDSFSKMLSNCFKDEIMKLKDNDIILKHFGIVG